MSVSDASDGKAQLVAALRVRKHAKQGIAAGFVFAVAMYAVFILGRVSVLAQIGYLSLLAVLALTTGAVVTTILVGIEAYRLAKEDDQPASGETEQ